MKNKNEEIKMEEIFSDRDFVADVIFNGTWAFLIAFTVLFIVMIFFLSFEMPTIVSNSMEPSIFTKDVLVVRKNIKEVRRGDIISFKNPYAPEDRGSSYIKRVIGLPGEMIEMKDSVVYINNKPLDEGYLNKSNEEYYDAGHSNVKAFRVPNGTYYVLGDNRHLSLDSRNFGVVKKEDIIGKGFIVVPTGKFSRSNIQYSY